MLRRLTEDRHWTFVPVARIAIGCAQLEEMIAFPRARGTSDILGGEPHKRGKILAVRKLKQGWYL